jgi:branched-chain amino acid transport system substrate-binding protein
VFKKLGPSILQIPFPTNFSPDLLNDPAAKAFATKYNEKYGEKPDSYAVQGYTALYFIGQGMKGLNAAPTREALGESMSKMTSLERNLYGGLPIQNGQAILEKPILAQWSDDGRIIEWKKQ